MLIITVLRYVEDAEERKYLHDSKDASHDDSRGSEDPVGDFGKGVRKIYERYKAAGIKDVTLRLYAGDMHELLNETDRDQVYEDLYEWLESKI